MYGVDDPAFPSAFEASGVEGPRVAVAVEVEAPLAQGDAPDGENGQAEGGAALGPQPQGQEAEGVNEKVEKQDAAARAIVPGAEFRDVKGTWPRGMVKPDSKALKKEARRRSGCNTIAGKQIEGMSMAQLQLYLSKTPPPAEPPQVNGEGGQGAPAPAPAPQNVPPAPGADGDERERTKWCAVIHSPRLLMAIMHADCKTGFLERDKKVLDRAELDGAARNSSWQKIAVKFNDRDFKPALLVCDDETINELFVNNLNPSSAQGYVADASRLEDKFKTIRKLIKAALKKFRTSGMGDMGMGDATEEEKTSRSYAVYSSKFYDYCDGNIDLMYWYEGAVKSGILESVAGEMPIHAKSTSDEPGKADKPRGKNSRKAALDVSWMQRAFAKPVKLSKTADEKRASHHMTKVMRQECMFKKQATISQMMLNLERVVDLGLKFSEKQQPIPLHVTNMKAKLEKQLASLIDEDSDDDDDDGFLDDGFLTDNDDKGAAGPSSSHAGPRGAAKPARTATRDSDDDEDDEDDEDDDGK